MPERYEYTENPMEGSDWWLWDGQHLIGTAVTEVMAIEIVALLNREHDELTADWGR